MVAILLAEGFEEIEALVPADLLRRAGIDVNLVGVDGRTVTGGHGITVQADVTLQGIRAEELEMLVLPGGGTGVRNLQANLNVLTLIQKAEQGGIWVAAICAAPIILAHLGLLDRRQGVCYPGLADEMGSTVLHPSKLVVVDGRMITAQAAGSAYEFGLALISVLAGESRAEEVCHAIHYSRAES